MSECAEKISQALTDLVTLRKEIHNTKETEVPAPELQYYTMYANMDRMYKKLPENVVEKLNLKFVSMIYDEIKKQE